MSATDQKIVLVTGSGRKRVGYVVAKSLAKAGYGIALHYHSSEESALENAEELRSLHVPVDVFQADVTDEREVRDMCRAVQEKFGRLDVLVTTSSIWKTIPLKECTAEDVLNSFRVNTLGTFLCCKYAGLIMESQEQGGCIVTIGDWAIERPYVDHAAYFTAKGSIPTLTRTFAVELAALNPRIRVNCLHPGPVMFPADMSAEEKEATREATLVKQADCPESMARAVQFLIENDFITGVCLPIDGGRSIFAPTSARS